MVGVQSVQTQETAYQVMENPFQDEFDYEINSELMPLIEVDGVRLVSFAISVDEDRDLTSDKPIPLTVEVALTNTNSQSVRAFVIALLEDSEGDALDRLECSQISAGKNRDKQISQKFKLPGPVLEATRKIYLFFEVER